ncbi:MAG: alpha/beta hydrolase [Opitutales bacterium]|jgi:alpha-L-fucosidase 2
MKQLLLLLALLALAPRAFAGLTTDIEYAHPGNISLKLDADIPDGPGPFPAAILVHGGGWSGGNKSTEISPLFAPLTKARIAWFSVDYRLAPQFRYPACVEDVETAVRWVKAHAAQFHIDPARLALVGESAGGEIVDMVAVRATPATHVAAVVAFYAPCDNIADTQRRGGPSKSMQQLLGIPPGLPMSNTTLQALHDVSPIFFVNKNLPPYLLVHGTADKSVPYQQSVQWQAKLLALGVPCDLITIKDGPHVMGRWENLDPTYKDKTAAWLAAHLAPHHARRRLVAVDAPQFNPLAYN